jgi:hypothetical protein
MLMRAVLVALLLGGGATAAGAASVNVAEFGAVPDDGLDDRAAFDAAVVAALLDGSGIVNVPCGVFDVTRTPGTLGAINVSGAHALTIRGEGPCSVVRNVSAAPSDFSTFNVESSREIHFEDLTLDRVRAFSAFDVSFDRVTLRNPLGDALEVVVTQQIRLTNSHVEGRITITSGEATQIHGNTFVSQRGCLAADRLLRDTSIIGNHFACDVDNRGSGVAGGSGLFFGQVGVAGPTNLIISQNHISLGDADAPQFGVALIGGSGRSLVTGNVFVSQQTGATGAAAVSLKSTVAGQVTRGLAVLGNVIEGFGAGLRLAGAPGIIEDAMFVQNTVIDTGIVGAGVSCSGTVSPSVMIGPNILGAGAPFTGPCQLRPFSAP